jgi:hypothetical protein
MKKITIVFLLSILYSVTFAQNSKFSIGIDLKPTHSDFTSKHRGGGEFGEGYSFPNSYAAGLTLDYFINKHFSLKSGLKYERKGTKTYWGINADLAEPVSYVDKIINFDYLILPVSVSFSTKGDIKFYFDAGVYTGFLVNQNEFICARENSPARIEYNYDKVKKLDFGLDIGSGLIFPLTDKITFDFGIFISAGLININKNYSIYGYGHGVMRTNSDGFQLGLKYNL